MANKKPLNPKSTAATKAARTDKLKTAMSNATKKGPNSIQISGKVNSTYGSNYKATGAKINAIKNKLETNQNKITQKVTDMSNQIQNQIPVSVKEKLKNMSKGVRF